MNKKILILTGRSLFTAGVISKLRNSPSEGDFEVVDMCQPDPWQAVLKINPDVLLVDETDPEFSDVLKEKLFTNIPHLKVIFLDPQKNQLRVMQWDEHDNSQIWDLLNDVNATPAEPQNPLRPLTPKSETAHRLNANLNCG